MGVGLVVAAKMLLYDTLISSDDAHADALRKALSAATNSMF